ncbi:uncharacterized protein K441DRAFT_590534, partial [Cenococcum geophilum 1.58]
VIYTTTLFLFGLSKCLYYIMLEFLYNFTSLNMASFRKIIKLDNKRNVADFLKR